MSDQDNSLLDKLTKGDNAFIKGAAAGYLLSKATKSQDADQTETDTSVYTPKGNLFRFSCFAIPFGLIIRESSKFSLIESLGIFPFLAIIVIGPILVFKFPKIFGVYFYYSLLVFILGIYSFIANTPMKNWPSIVIGVIFALMFYFPAVKICPKEFKY